jgi:hypothetical protein
VEGLSCKAMEAMEEEEGEEQGEGTTKRTRGSGTDTEEEVMPPRSRNRQ